MAASPPKLSPAQPSSLHTERSLLPVGITTILPDAAARVRGLEQTLLTGLGAWGYREIILPTFEYLDVLTPGLHSQVLEKGYQLTDRTTGRTLVLRPDATAQIARTVAMGMLGDALPLRISYRTSVFRYEPEHVGRDREQLQIGVELIGVSGPAGDAEVLALVIESLRRLGVKSFRISLGHVGFLQGLLRQSGLSPADQARAVQAAARRDIPELQTMVSAGGVSRASARAILEAPELYGGKNVLTRGRVLAGRNRPVLAALDRLEAVFRLLAAGGYEDYLLLDLGELRGFDYYDGIVFDVFAEGVGYEIGGGGRYDHLIGRFGRTVPSTGFAFDVDRLFRVLDAVDTALEPQGVDCLLAGPVAMTGAILSTANRLRAGGARVVQGTPVDAGPEGLRASLDEARRVRAGAIVWQGIPPLRPTEALLVSAPDRYRDLPSMSVPRLKQAGAQVLAAHDLDHAMLGRARARRTETDAS